MMRPAPLHTDLSVPTHSSVAHNIHRTALHKGKYTGFGISYRRYLFRLTYRISSHFITLVFTQLCRYGGKCVQVPDQKCRKVKKCVRTPHTKCSPVKRMECGMRKFLDPKKVRTDKQPNMTR